VTRLMVVLYDLAGSTPKVNPPLTRVDQFGHHIFVFTQNAEIGVLEDGSFRVVINCHDRASLFDSIDMLDSTTNANGYVHLGAYGSARFGQSGERIRPRPHRPPLGYRPILP